MVPEWTTGLIQQVETAIDKAELVIGSSGFELTTAESNFIKIVRKAAEDDREALQEQWTRALKRVTPQAWKAEPVKQTVHVESPTMEQSSAPRPPSGGSFDIVSLRSWKSLEAR